MIKVCNLSLKLTDEFFTLLNVDLTIDQNTVFVGERDEINSLFRCILNIEKSYSGDIFIDGINTKNIKDYDISYVPNTPCLINNKSIFYNIIYPIKIRKYDEKIIDRIANKNEIVLKNKKNFKNIAKNYVKNMISTYKIDNFSKNIKKLSNSQKLIITLVRAIIRKPKYLILENLFEELNENEINLAVSILSNYSGIIIAGDKNPNLPIYKNFTKYYINDNK